MFDFVCYYINDFYLSERMWFQSFLLLILIALNITLIIKFYKKIVLLWFILSLLNFVYVLGGLVLPDLCVTYEFSPLQEKWLVGELSKKEKKRFEKLRKRPDIGPKLTFVYLLGLPASAFYSLLITIGVFILSKLWLLYKKYRI